MAVELVELTAIDRLIRLLAGLKALPTTVPGTHKRLFTTYVKPTNDLMRAIHIDYVRAFRAAREELSGTDHLASRADPEVERALKRAADIVWKRRQKYEDKRDILRHDAQAYLANVPIAEMRRFFVATCDYFILDDDCGFIWMDDDRDKFIEGLAERGGLSKYDTPTTRFLREIKEAETVEHAIMTINEVLNNLNVKYFNVVNAYQSVEMTRHLL